MSQLAVTWAAPQTSQSKPLLVVSGTVAACYALATGRWGAYIGQPPVYPLDVLIVVSGVHYAMARLSGRVVAADWLRGGGAIVAILFTFVLLRLVAGGHFSAVALRDAAPYLYSIVAILSAHAYASSSVETRERSARWVRAGLLFHLGWCSVAIFVPTVTEVMPSTPGSGAVRLFSLQYSNDGVVLGITAALYLVRYLRTGGLGKIAVVGLAMGLMLSMTSRGALLGTAVVVLVAIFLVFSSGRGVDASGGRRKLLFVAVLPLVLVAFATALPHTTAGGKLLSTMGLTAVQTDIDRGGIGTARAREAAWDRVLHYVDQQNRQAVGVGFGPNFMADSGGAVAMLSGRRDEVRSPHSFPVSVYARTGVVGLLMWGALIALLLQRVWALRRRAAMDDLVLLSLLVPLGIFISALFGPMMEGPFGAIPFFWFLGIALNKVAGRPQVQARSVPGGRPTARWR